MGIPTSERRDYFNSLSGIVVLTGTLVGLGVGWSWGGVFGSLLVGGASLTVACRLVDRERMSR